MNTDDLRDALAQEAEQIPAVTIDLADGVDRSVRRQRRTRALLVVPPVLCAAAVLGAVVLVPRQAPDAVSTEAASGGGSGATTPGSSAPTAAPPAGGDCGTISVSIIGGTADVSSQAARCFVTAFNAGVPASLTVTTTGTGGHALTEQVHANDHVLTVDVSGSVTFDLASMVGLPTSSASGPVKDCGSVTISGSTVSGHASGTAKAGAPGSGSASGSVEHERGSAASAASSAADTADAASELAKFGPAANCVVEAFIAGTPAHLEVAVDGSGGGTIKGSVDLAGHVVTVALAGTVTETVPAGTIVPEQLLSHLPSGQIPIPSISQLLQGKFPGTPPTTAPGHK
jgi:hypothetical protein